MIASSAQKGDAELVKNIGFSGYLSKPFKRTELIGVLSDVVAMGNQEAKSELVTRYSIIEQRPSSKKLKILLVEDMVANQKLEMIVLKKLGYQVELCADGKQAVEKCNEKKFDLILMDCQMPVMDGYEATELIRKTSALNNNTPIIAMTAHSLEGDRDKCIFAGMDDYISKPIIMDRLADILDKHLNRVY
jgi:CheY-like chemotaxis protein